MTKFESALELALGLDDRERELLVIEVTQSLETQNAGSPIWEDPRVIAELERRIQHAREHPETLMEWDEAEKEIFGDDPDL